MQRRYGQKRQPGQNGAGFEQYQGDADQAGCLASRQSPNAKTHQPDTNLANTGWLVRTPTLPSNVTAEATITAQNPAGSTRSMAEDCTAWR